MEPLHVIHILQLKFSALIFLKADRIGNQLLQYKFEYLFEEYLIALIFVFFPSIIFEFLNLYIESGLLVLLLLLTKFDHYRKKIQPYLSYL